MRISASVSASAFRRVMPAMRMFADVWRCGRSRRDAGLRGASIRPIGIRDREPAQNFALGAFHLHRVSLPFVIVADQVQETMHGKMGDMMGERLALRRAPRARWFQRQERCRRDGRLAAALFGRERQHVGGRIDAPPIPVERAYCRIIGQNDSKLRAVVDSAAAGLARRRAARAIAAFRHPSTVADDQHVDLQRGRAPRASFPALALLRRFLVIGLDDARDELVADDVGGGKADMADAFDAFEQPHRVGQARRSGPAAGPPGSDRRSPPSGCSRRAGSATFSSASRWCSAPRRE